ncbi:MAG: TonB-dependent receptor [Armatimonadetes bacterium]|nr:TonB-dependent receptor [Armatimonadota bacterium]
MKFRTNLLVPFLAALLLALAVVADASTTGIISGVVTDIDTGAKLSGVNVMVKGTGLTTVTDANGYFVITNVPPGAYEVTVSLVGYGEVKRSDIQVLMDVTSPVDVELTKVELEAPEAVITAPKKSLLQPDMAPAFYVVPSKQEKMAKNQPNNLYQIPGIVGTQPGITLDGDGRPHIRGGRGNEIGYMLEGIPVTEPLTNNFGTNTVTVGMSKMQIYTGGYRAEYGNAISGVFNEIKKTGSDAPGARLELTGGAQDYAGSYFEYGGVAPSGLDYYVGSYLWRTKFERMFFTGADSSDNIGKFVYPKGNDKFTLLVNQGSARYYLDSIHDFTYLNEAVTPEADHGHQGYDILGLTWSHNFSPSSFLTVRPYTYNTKAIVDALSPTGPMRSYLDYGTKQRGFQMEYTNQMSENHLLRTGANTIRSRNRYMAWVPGLGAALGQPDWGDYHYNVRNVTNQIGMFVQDQAKIGERWRAEVGLRYDGMKYDKSENPDVTESQISPRLGLTYSLDKKNVLKASWGKFIQFAPAYVMERIYVNPDWNEYRLGNLDLDPERSTSFDVSLERQVSDTMLARITPFYRTYSNLLQSRRADPNDPLSMTSIYVNSGKGKTSGVECYLSRKMTKNWEGWLSYTYMRAKANASSFSSTIDPSIWSYVDWDQRHTLNLVAAYKRKSWEHNFQVYFGSGTADAVTASTVQYQDHGESAIVFSWNIIKNLPQGSMLGDQVFLNIWNLFNTGKATHFRVYPDGSKAAESWTVPRFVTLGISRSF